VTSTGRRNDSSAGVIESLVQPVYKAGEARRMSSDEKGLAARNEEIAILFTEARTHSAWLDRPLDDALLHRLYDLAKMGPTGGNAHPMRVVFVKSPAAKERLRPALAPMNVDKTMSAPATAIIAFDTEFYEKMPKLFPARPEMRDNLASRPVEVRERMAYQGATLSAGYLILAARALGLDCGPMGGFDTGKVDAAFFAHGKWKSTLLINVGYGVREKLFPRNPRLSFEEACRIE
jgi:3-hydroxypropanoate dehydrogenase